MMKILNLSIFSKLTPELMLKYANMKQSEWRKCLCPRKRREAKQAVLTQLDLQFPVFYLRTNIFSLFQDPYKSFGLPSIGRLSQYQEPLDLPNVSTQICLASFFFSLSRKTLQSQPSQSNYTYSKHCIFLYLRKKVYLLHIVNYNCYNLRYVCFLLLTKVLIL